MSNYIAHVVAKNLNTLDTIKPRVATLFEPQRMARELTANSSFDDDGITGEANWRPSESNALLTPARLEPFRSMEQPLPEHAHKPRSQDSISDLPALAPQQPRRSLPSDPESENQLPTIAVRHLPFPQREAHPIPLPASVNVQARAPMTHASQQASVQSAERPALITRPQAAPRLWPAPATVEERDIHVQRSMPSRPSGPESLALLQANSPHEAVTSSGGRLENQPRLIVPQATDQPAAAKAELSRSTQLEPAIVRLVRASLDERLATPSRKLHPTLTERGSEGLKTATESAPVIHVTIGRVEVRATTSNAPAPVQPRAAGPRMSLEDYLRQRSDGGRP